MNHKEGGGKPDAIVQWKLTRSPFVVVYFPLRTARFVCFVHFGRVKRNYELFSYLFLHCWLILGCPGIFFLLRFVLFRTVSSTLWKVPVAVTVFEWLNAEIEAKATGKSLFPFYVLYFFLPFWYGTTESFLFALKWSHLKCVKVYLLMYNFCLL